MYSYIEKYILNSLLFLFLCTGYSTQAQQTIIENFSFTGAPQYWTVPSCVTSISVTIAGAEGGGTYGGNGAILNGTLTVVPGQQLEINVGGEANLQNGGWNGGGNGSTANGLSNYSYGGGGASEQPGGGVGARGSGDRPEGPGGANEGGTGAALIHTAWARSTM